MSTLAALFAAQAARFPERVAAVCAAQTITYSELNRRANRLAHALRQRGIGSSNTSSGAQSTGQSLVGLYVERSLESLVGMLAIVKAGGAYVPLDTAYPLERRAWMIADAGLSLVLTQEALRPLLPANIDVLTLDALPTGSELASPLVDDPAHDTTLPDAPESLAYVMYTSGSTGTPKGVCVPQRGVVRLVCEPDYVPLGPHTVMLYAASPAFDAATFEVWGSLLNGGKLVILPNALPTLADIGQTIAAQSVNTVWLTASLFHTVVDLQPDILRGVRWLLAGGDALSPRHIRRAAALLPDCQIINGYGPTENTTFTCCYPISRSAMDWPTVPIGKAIRGTQVYVVDAQGRIVPPGMPGELLAGGAGVATGYLNRPELTAEKFLPDTLSGRAGGLLYRTGDRVRQRDDGSLEFLGRLDAQVKIRGFRIEPGEIELRLRQHPDVTETVVLALPDAQGNRSLAACVQTIANSGLTPTALREWVAATLPAYMVPSRWLLDTALPLTPNGKLDRPALMARLTAPETSLPQTPRNLPVTDLERTVAARWQTVLECAEVDCTTSFFEAGGSSLQLVQLHSHLCAALNRNIALADLFRFPTVRTFAAHLGAADAAPAPESGATGAAPFGIQERAARQRAAMLRSSSPRPVRP